MNTRWLFIVGCTNSGTTILWRLLREHPNISYLFREGNILAKRMVRCATKKDDARLWALYPERYYKDETHDIGRLLDIDSFWKTKTTGPTDELILNKSPQFLMKIRWLKKYMPESKFIYIVRHPVPVSEGIVRRMKEYHLKTTLVHGANQWLEASKIGRRDIAHAGGITVKYEEFCANPSAELMRLAEFAGVNPEPFSSVPDIRWNTGMYHRKLRNMNKRSTSVLSELQTERIMEICGEEASSYGYR